MINNVASSKFDPISLNAIYLDRRTLFEKQIPACVKTHGMWYYWWRVIYAIIKEIVKIIAKVPLRQWFAGWDGYKKIYDGTTLFVLPSLNNLRSLEKVIDKVRANKGNTIVLHGNDYYKSFPRFYILWKSIANILFLMRRISNLSPADRRIVGHYISLFFLTPGYVCCYLKMLSKYKPDCIIMSNDHVGDCKALIYICEKIGIKTLYVQHASVSYAFPELHFAYSFLDGKDAFEKYTAEGKKTNGEVMLLGAVRFDGLSKYRLSRSKNPRNCIGIAVNKLDDHKTVNDFCNELLETSGDLKIKIRSHPSMKNNPFVFDNKERIVYTCATDENIIDFLDSIDLQVAGDSGVHLDAILGGVPTIAFNFSSLPFGDNYKYVENGLVKRPESMDGVIDLIRSGQDMKIDDMSVRPYDESYGKSYSGHCSDIVADFIIGGCDWDSLKDKCKMERHTHNGSAYWVIPNIEV